MKLNTPEFRIEIDRAKVADLGIDVNVVGRTLETLLGGRQVTRFEMNGEQYDVIVQLATEDRASPATLDTIFLRSPRGEMVQLSNIVKVTESVAPKELKRFNQLRSVTISANLAPGYALGEALDYLEAAAHEVLPPTVQTDVSGQSREYRAAGQSLALVFVLALGFIYLVLAAQFESFRDPLDHPAHRAAVDDRCARRALFRRRHAQRLFADRSRDAGRAHHQARHSDRRVRQPAAGAGRRATRGRDRGGELAPAADPDDDGAMVLGALPLALAEGAGAESRQQIGWVIVGGMPARHAADAVRRADRAQLPRRPPRRDGRACRGRRPAGRIAGDLRANARETG